MNFCLFLFFAEQRCFAAIYKLAGFSNNIPRRANKQHAHLGQSVYIQVDRRSVKRAMQRRERERERRSARVEFVFFRSAACIYHAHTRDRVTQRYYTYCCCCCCCCSDVFSDLARLRRRELIRLAKRARHKHTRAAGGGSLVCVFFFFFSS